MESSEEAFGEAYPLWWRAEVEWERMSVEEKAVWRARAEARARARRANAKEGANTNQK